MKRRELLTGCLGLPAAAEPPAVNVEDFYRRLQEFDRHYQAFINSLCGWPKQDKCRPDLGIVDTKEFEEARKAAMRLWDLEEKTNGK